MSNAINLSFPKVAVNWILEEEPHLPSAALYPRSVWNKLARSISQRKEDDLKALKVVLSSNAIILLGEQLPWLPEVAWFYQHEDADKLYLPQHKRCGLPPDIFQSAVQQQWGKGSFLIMEDYRYWSLSEARQLYKDVFLEWLANEIN